MEHSTLRVYCNPTKKLRDLQIEQVNSAKALVDAPIYLDLDNSAELTWDEGKHLDVINCNPQ